VCKKYCVSERIKEKKVSQMCAFLGSEHNRYNQMRLHLENRQVFVIIAFESAQKQRFARENVKRR